MGGSELKAEVFHRILGRSFVNPATFSGDVDGEISRSRSLRSQERGELKDLLFDALRWRRRIWGDIAPTHVKWEDVVKRLEEARALKSNPPLARWSTKSMESLACELSFPTWLVEHWVRRLGLTAAVPLMLSLNEAAPVTLRANTLKTDREALKKALSEEDVPGRAGAHSPWALHLSTRRNLRSLPCFKKGWFEIQDEGSQVAVLESRAQAGEKVVDACTGAGGKALALAALMKNQGEILAVDCDSRPLEELKTRAKRAGAGVIQPRWVAVDDPAPLPDWSEKADLVFLDAPCSGVGTLRRQPWLKWLVSRPEVEGFASRQAALLKRYARIVKPGGRLLYVTCSLLSTENEEVVARVRQEDPSLQPSRDFRTLYPHVEGTDGFFIAVLGK